MTHIIGIDIGTTNTKAVAFTKGGEVLASAGASYTARTDTQGKHELDPGHLLEAVVAVLKETARKTAGMEGLAGVSFSAAMHSLIAVDREGKPLTQAITWADLRSRTYAESLRGTAAGKRIYQQTGTPVHAMSPLCKLLWLKDTEPAIFEQAARFISIKEYIWWRLFGKYQVDHSIASATGLFDIYSFDWYGESLALAGIRPDRLSAPVPCTHIESELLPSFRDALGLPEGLSENLPEGLPGKLPFIIGGSDGCLANLGSNAVRPGETALTIGTSGAIRMTAGAPKHDPKERIFNYILTKDRYVSGGGTNNGGGVVQWYIENFLGRPVAGAGDRGAGARDAVTGPGNIVAAPRDGAASSQDTVTAEFIAEAEKALPGSEGLVFLPYLQGERAPVWDAAARGVFFGIRSVHEQRHFMRAVLEGICFSLFQVGLSLEETIGPIRHIYASGGFTRSKVWLQMAADIFNKKIYVTGVADASAIGAVMMGWLALGEVDSLEEAAGVIRVQEAYEPDEDRHRIYRRNFEVYAVLYDRLKDLM